MSLAEALENHGSNPALTEGEKSYSASALLDCVRVLAAKLREEDIRRVLLRSSSPLSLITALAAAQQGGCDLFLAHASLPESSFDRLVETHRIDAVLVRGDGAELSLSRTRPRCEAGTPRDCRIYLMTSGTTGVPKVAAHRFESLAGEIGKTRSSASARWLLTYPGSSFAGLQVILTSLLGGGTLIAPAASNPEALALAATNHQASHVSGTPSFWRAFFLALGETPLPSLRQITLGGEPVDQPLLDRLSALFPQAQIAHIYASTEAGALFAVRDRREGFPASWLDSGIGGVGLRIVDHMLEVKSPRRMLGYASGHETPITPDGWIRTGDRVRAAGDRVFFTGRADLRINIGGYKVSAEEIERALVAVEGIADARVIGVPNPLTGQALVAEVLYAPGYDKEVVQTNAIRQLKAGLESYKVPRIFRTLDSPALAASGKKARPS